MATLIPAFNSCKPRMTSGERRLAERLEAKLEDDYLLWFDVPLGTSGFHPDFMGEAVDDAFKKAGIPASWLNRNSGSRSKKGEDAVSIFTLHSSKGLEFPVVALPGIGYLPRATDDVNDEARLMSVGMTRAMNHLVMTCHQTSPFVERLRELPGLRCEAVVL